MKPRLLDLYSCAGGAARGYQLAGFHVTGVDIRPMPRYAGDVFVQGDALEYVAKHGHEYDAIHASPPCQAYSDLAHRTGKEYPRLIEPTRKLLQESGKPYVIENVDGAPLDTGLLLCGTMFGLRVLRHRRFETSFLMFQPPHGAHPKVFTHDKRKAHYGQLNEWEVFVQVTGGGNCSLAAAREAMGIDWMNKGEINKAIPPAYTEYIGAYLMQALAIQEGAY